MDVHNKKPSGFRKKIAKTIAVTLGTLVMLGLVSFASIETYTLVARSGAGLIASSGAAAPATTAAPAQAAPLATPALSTGDTKLTTTAASATGALGTQQVYKLVRDSVVTVENYGSRSVRPAGEGSGIIMSADGYIITNEHVINGANTIQIVTAAGKKFDAKLVGADPRTDLAVLKVDAPGLSAAVFGDSGQVQVAEPVLAIGNPGGIEFSGSVTQGIVSALDRNVITESGYTTKCIQTDAAINPGNSGGALVNMQGQVIGITSAKIVASGFEGMGFAIPINAAQPVVNDLISHGYVTGRVKLGISVSEISADRAKALGYPVGLMVQGVDSNSDAYAQGIRANDIMTMLNGTDVETYDAFYKALSRFKVGDSITLTLFRISTGKTFDVTVKLAEDKGTVQKTQQSPYQNPFSFSFGQQY